jgi:hypothetical protein
MSLEKPITSSFPSQTYKVEDASIKLREEQPITSSFPSQTYKVEDASIKLREEQKKKIN